MAVTFSLPIKPQPFTYKPAFCDSTEGEVTEWLKVHAWNACVRKYREFESLPLRQ